MEISAPVNESLIKYLSIGKKINNAKHITRNNENQMFKAHDSTLYDIESLSLKILNFSETREFYERVLGNNNVMIENDNTIVIGHQPCIKMIESDNFTKDLSKFSSLFHFSCDTNGESHLASLMTRALYHYPQQYRGSADNGYTISFYMEDPAGNVVEFLYNYSIKPNMNTHANIEISHNDVDVICFIQNNFSESFDKNYDMESISLGHIHFQCSTTHSMKKFYRDVLGFDVMMELPTVVFLGNSLHYQQISVNSWNNVKKDSLIVEEDVKVSLSLQNIEDISKILGRVMDSSVIYWMEEDKICFRDPMNNIIEILLNDSSF